MKYKSKWGVLGINQKERRKFYQKIRVRAYNLLKKKHKKEYNKIIKKELNKEYLKLKGG